jgi:release factor glutamine methyltransferase
LSVGPGVFLPRPETEVVVGHALAALEQTTTTPVVVDLCAGSGVIAAAICAERPNATVHAVERDPGAAPWLRHNGRVHGFEVHVDDAAACLPELNQRVDLIIANPPYIPQDAVPRDPEVARFDPAMALYSGADGLDHIRMVEQAAARLLRAGGFLVVEHGDLQGEMAPAVFAASPEWVDVADHVDLNGRDRYLTATRRPDAHGDQ